MRDNSGVGRRARETLSTVHRICTPNRSNIKRWNSRGWEENIRTYGGEETRTGERDGGKSLLQREANRGTRCNQAAATAAPATNNTMDIFSNITVNLLYSALRYLSVLVGIAPCASANCWGTLLPRSAFAPTNDSNNNNNNNNK